MAVHVLLAPVFERAEHVLCAVSGGADSVALLLLLKEAQERGELRLSAAHFEHGIRGEQSLADARFVQDLCAELGVECEVGHADVPHLACLRSVGLEQAARDARHAFLREAMARCGATCIALAHHQGDQAETVLMHLLRGAGARGAGGMRPREGALARPLLHANKAQLVAYLDARGQAYVTDHTNFQPDGPRNQLRLWVMPAIRQIYPRADAALARHARLAQEEDELLGAQAERWLAQRQQRLPMGVRILWDADAHPALVRRALLRALHGLIDPPGQRVADGFEVASRLTALYVSASGKLSIAAGVSAERTGAWLYLLSEVARPPQATPLADGCVLDGLCRIRVSPTEPVPRRETPYAQVLSAAALSGAALRTRRQGDRFQMLGAPGDRLLSDVLIDKKIDRPLRDWLPLLADAERVLWVPGLGISQQARLTGGEQGALLVEYEGFRVLQGIQQHGEDTHDA